MAILVLKILAIWWVGSTFMAFSLGAAIARGDRARKAIFLDCVFASLEAMETYRS